ncbi:MAG TPA: DnaJ domain-containing protein [Thermodesulfovibrionales bacterium]|nr:DnaJ domain-containing protein [Thermodesulfovibrionales bacterium]
MEDLYAVLGVSGEASEADIKKAFRQLAKEYHPDSLRVRETPADAEKRFLQITDAYKVLSDSAKRAEYDRNRGSGKGNVADSKQPGNAKTLYREGRRAYRHEQFEDASTHFRKAVKLAPENPLYCSWLGLSLSKQHGLLHEAKSWCEKATLLAPSNPDYYVNLSLVYRNAGIKALTEKYLRKALSINPSHKRARIWLDRITGTARTGIMSRIKAIFRSQKE